MRIRGLTWAEGTLWVGQYRDRKIYQIDPETVAILRTIEFNRFVTEVTWVEEELSPPPHQNIADSRTIKDYSKANSEPDALRSPWRIRCCAIVVHIFGVSMATRHHVNFITY